KDEEQTAWISALKTPLNSGGRIRLQESELAQRQSWPLRCRAGIRPGRGRGVEGADGDCVERGRNFLPLLKHRIVIRTSGYKLPGERVDHDLLGCNSGGHRC